MARGQKPAKSKEAKPSAARKSRKEEGSEVRDLEKRLEAALRGKAEALKLQADSQEELQTRDRELVEAQEQQRATAEILRVISSSPTDPQPVFDTIAASARRLCAALFSIVFRFDGELITVVAADGASQESLDVIRSAYPAPPGRLGLAAQAILERRVIAIADAQSDIENPLRPERAGDRLPQRRERSDAAGQRGDRRHQRLSD